MPWNWTRVAGVCGALLLSGCATDAQTLLPHGDATMRDIWSQQTGGLPGLSSRALLEARQTLRRPLLAHDVVVDQNAYTRTAQTEIYRQFKRLPNPDLVMYVFAHLAGSDPVPVPGYSTVFALHQRVHYALPGERVDDY